MTKKVLAAGVAIAALALVPAAHANDIAFAFSGAGVSGSILFSLVPNVSPPDPNPLCGTPGNNPCRSDPTGADRIAGITGTFSAPGLGIFDAAITGLVPTAPANERDPVFDPLVPTSLSFIDFPGGHLTYNNLAFPDGSPIDCNYLFSGTFLDVYGTAFTIAGGDTVNIWGDGNFSFGPLTYGVGVTDGTSLLDYQFSGIAASVPEPGSLALFGTFLLSTLLWRRGAAGSRATGVAAG